MAIKLEYKIKCPVCGFKDTEKYCSRCGNKLENLPHLWTPTYQNILEFLKEFSLEIINPTFTFLKTAWLLIIDAEYFFETLFLKTKPINDISFPLSSIWRKIDRGGFQNIFNPIQFYLASLAPSILLTLLVAVFGGINQIEKNLIQALFFEQVSNIGILTSGIIYLFYPLSVAFIFDILTENDPIPYKFKYTFWIYMFGLIIAIPPLFLIIANTFFIPNNILFGIAAKLSSNITPSDANQIITQNSEFFRSLISIPRDIILAFLIFAFLGIIPFNVFRRVYRISEKRLIMIILVSTVSPLLLLLLSIYTCFIPVVILIPALALYNSSRSNKKNIT